MADDALSSEIAAKAGREAHRRILLVEDDAADAYLITRALSDVPSVGEVVHARNGVEALAKVESDGPFDLAFVDLHMPMMNGFELLMSCAERGFANLPMVVLTSSSSPSDAVRSKVRGALRVVTKPESVSEMYAVLMTTIDVVCRPRADAAADANPGRALNHRPQEAAPRTLRRNPLPGRAEPSFS